MSALYWRNGESKKPYYVGLERTTAVSLAGPGKPVSKEIGGRRGELYVGPSFSLHIEWLLPGRECNYLALVLVVPQNSPLTSEEAERELVKIAESLRSVGRSDNSRRSL
jgi:hypothetical protein